MVSTKVSIVSRLVAVVSCAFISACALDAASGSSPQTASRAAKVGAATATETVPAVEPQRLAQGQRLFNLHCMACHAVNADGRTAAGPHLEGIFGRQIATDASWVYPEHVADFDFIWTEETMRQWLITPQEMVHNMCLPFRGLRRESDVDALLAYLLDAT